METGAYATVVLDIVAVALILAPEPFTTPIGISLLSYSRKLKGQSQGRSRRRPVNRFERDYSYQLNLINQTHITYEIHTKLDGQLSHYQPHNARMLYAPPETPKLKSKESNAPDGQLPNTIYPSTGLFYTPPEPQRKKSEEPNVPDGQLSFFVPLNTKLYYDPPKHRKKKSIDARATGGIL